MCICWSINWRDSTKMHHAKLWNFSACWLYYANILAMHGHMNVKKKLLIQLFTLSNFYPILYIHGLSASGSGLTFTLHCFHTDESLIIFNLNIRNQNWDRIYNILCSWDRVSQLYINKCPKRYNCTQFILPVICSTCFGWFLLPSSGAQITVLTASGTSQL